MAQMDFEDGILALESGAGAARQLNSVTLMSQLVGALNVRIAANTASSQAVLKMRGVRDRVLQLANEVDAQGAGLQVRP